MPLASAAAALLGGLLMFWRRVVGWVKAVAHRVAGLFGRDPGSLDMPPTAAGPQRRKRPAKRRVG